MGYEVLRVMATISRYAWKDTQANRHLAGKVLPQRCHTGFFPTAQGVASRGFTLKYADGFFGILGEVNWQSSIVL